MYGVLKYKADVIMIRQPCFKALVKFSSKLNSKSRKWTEITLLARKKYLVFKTETCKCTTFRMIFLLRDHLFPDMIKVGSTGSMLDEANPKL